MKREHHRAPTTKQWCRRCQTGVREHGAVNYHKVELKEQAKTRQFSRVSRERENRAHRCPQQKEGEKSHEQSLRRVIWLRKSNKRIEKLHREVAHWSRLQWETAVWSFREREKQTDVDRVCANQVQDRPQGCMSWQEIVWVSASEWQQASQEASGRSRHSARVSTFRKNKFELLES